MERLKKRSKCWKILCPTWTRSHRVARQNFTITNNHKQSQITTNNYKTWICLNQHEYIRNKKDVFISKMWFSIKGRYYCKSTNAMILLILKFAEITKTFLICHQTVILLRPFSAFFIMIKCLWAILYYSAFFTRAKSSSWILSRTDWCGGGAGAKICSLAYENTEKHKLKKSIQNGNNLIIPFSIQLSEFWNGLPLAYEFSLQPVDSFAY